MWNWLQSVFAAAFNPGAGGGGVTGAAYRLWGCTTFVVLCWLLMAVVYGLYCYFCGW